MASDDYDLERLLKQIARRDIKTPALSDACRSLLGTQSAWVIEEVFAGAYAKGVLPLLLQHNTASDGDSDHNSAQSIRQALKAKLERMLKDDTPLAELYSASQTNPP